MLLQTSAAPEVWAVRVAALLILSVYIKVILSYEQYPRCAVVYAKWPTFVLILPTKYVTVLSGVKLADIQSTLLSVCEYLISYLEARLQ